MAFSQATLRIRHIPVVQLESHSMLNPKINFTACEASRVMTPVSALMRHSHTTESEIKNVVNKRQTRIEPSKRET